MSTKVVIDCATGQVKTMPLTPAEEAQLSADQAGAVQLAALEEADRQARLQREADIDEMLAWYRANKQ